MAQRRATPQQPPLTQAQQDAIATLVALKIPLQEATDLVLRSPGADSGEIASNAIRLRSGAGPRAAVAPPAGAKLVAPVAPGGPSTPAPAPIPQAQQQMPGFGPPGGPAAAPTAQQLQQSISAPQRLAPPSPTGLEPMQFQHLPSAQEYAAGSQGPAQAGPNWFWRLMGASSPPPAPIAQRSAAAPPPVRPMAQRAPSSAASPVPMPFTRLPRAPSSAASPLPSPKRPPAPPSGRPTAAMPPPAPIKPRVRVRAVPGKVEEPAATPVEKPEAEELPLVSAQEEYDKLPVGARFRHPDGFIYRKERESGAREMQQGGAVTPPQPWEATWEATYGMPPEAQPGTQPEGQPEESTDTVPAKLTPGEYVVPKPAVDKIGKENLDAMTAVAQGKAPPGASTTTSTTESQAGRTPVGATGKSADVGSNPPLRALAYGPKSEGATAADMRQTKGAWDQPLQPGDIAVSPDMQGLYPLRSHVNVVDSKGNIILANARVADTSMIDKDHPTHHTFEIWNGPSLGSGYHLVPV